MYNSIIRFLVLTLALLALMSCDRDTRSTTLPPRFTSVNSSNWDQMIWDQDNWN